MLKHELFVREYIKDFNGTRAAMALGYSAASAPSAACQMLKRPLVKELLAKVISERSDRLQVEADWVLTELMENHHLARQKGDINASNKALETIGKHIDVGAFSEPMVAHTSNDLVEKLRRGRARVKLLRKFERIK